MSRKKKEKADLQGPFLREYSINVGNFIISSGDIIKIDGEHGTKFKFNSVVTNPSTGNTWIDCFELEKGLVSRFRSFKAERIKRIPMRRKRVSRR